MNKTKDIYIYPAIFSFDNDGISVEFPDLPGCLTFGNTDEDALYMAKDALRGWLLVAEQYKENITLPTKVKEIKLKKNQTAVLIEVCLSPYREAFRSRSVKKTLTIPAWLNEKAENEKINFSFVLQNALKEQLHLK